MREQVANVLLQIKPVLQAEGGDVELVDVKEEEGIVSVKLTGACGACPMAQITLEQGIARILKAQVPGVKEVVAVEPVP